MDSSSRWKKKISITRRCTRRRFRCAPLPTLFSKYRDCLTSTFRRQFGYNPYKGLQVHDHSLFPELQRLIFRPLECTHYSDRYDICVIIGGNREKCQSGNSLQDNLYDYSRIQYIICHDTTASSAWVAITCHWFLCL